TTVSCSQGTIRTLPDASRLVDWYLTYGCPSAVVGRGGISRRQSTCYLAGHNYSIQFQAPGNTTNGTPDPDSVLDDRLPSIWLVDSNPGKELLTPYLTLPMEPESGWHIIFDTHVAQRKFIVSSPLWDAIMGSDPTYETIVFFPRCAKLIAPFGLAGQFATKGFKRRLRERYHVPSNSEAQNSSFLGQGSDQTESRIDMTQFLLDYVIDMGPASAPIRREAIDSQSDSEDEEKYTQIQPMEGIELEETENRGNFITHSRK
ncbi:unnamed protein product, partial [Rhizoctonia solani]